jgi:hypothetical protein
MVLIVPVKKVNSDVVETTQLQEMMMMDLIVTVKTQNTDVAKMEKLKKYQKMTYVVKPVNLVVVSIKYTQ